MKIQGVKTTGIYCRADCGARPNPKNVQTMGSAVAALAAGFRPCLVCRPDRLPEFLPEFTPNQSGFEIAHAIRLIAEGFLDDSNTDQLAQRVGYCQRHLVRLFEQHIGATPDFVARARRAHLARRLLDESNLSITQVAFAAGFASLRQMNRVMKELFAFSPTELRSKRRRGDELNPLDGGLHLRVPVYGKLDVGRMIQYLGPRAIPGVESVDEQCYTRTMNTCGHPGVLEVRDSGSDHLNVTMHLATFGSIIDQVERVRSLFGLRNDGTDAGKYLKKDKWIGRIIRKQKGIRLPGAWDRFETSVRIIIGQQVSVAGASTLTGRLVKRFGTPIEITLPGSLEYLFPSADKLARANLRNLNMPEARAKTIKNFAQAITKGDVDLTAVGPLDETVATLEKIPGVGPWTAHFIAGRVMGHPDAFPASDLGLRKSAAKILGKETPLSESELTKLAENWRPFRATAAAHLWMALSDEAKKTPAKNSSANTSSKKKSADKTATACD